MAAPVAMLTHYQFLHSDVRPALARMPEKFQGAAAECMLIAIPCQETNYASTYQLDSKGKAIQTLARGLYQFEKVGVQGCLDHPANDWLRPFLVANGYLTPSADVIHWALPASSALAVWLARANLWWNAAPLVEPIADAEHEEASWEQYNFCWRPGKPNRGAWERSWRLAVEALNIPTNPSLVESEV